MTRSMWSFVSAEKADSTDGWKHFGLVLLPGLVSFVRGDLKLIGVPPRSEDEIRALPQDWQEVCLSRPPGLISEALVQAGPYANGDERYASDAFYSAAGNWRMDLEILAKYLMVLALGRPHQATDDPIIERPVRWP